jgi:hypothetical protein
LVAWRWVLGDWFSPPNRELTRAWNRQLTYTLTAPATASFNLPGRSDEAYELQEGITDLWVWADDQLCYRGRVIGVTDTVTENAYTLSVSTVDYRGLLGRRLLVEGDTLNWSMPTYADIAWGIVQRTQAKEGGGLGIVQGMWASDPPQIPSNYRVRNYNPGLEVGKALDDLASVAFDYEIRPDPRSEKDLALNYFYPGKRRTSAVVLDWGGTVTGLTRSSVVSQWANATRTSGDQETTIGRNYYTYHPEGRFEQQIGYPDVVLQSTIDERAIADHAAWLRRRSSLNLELKAGIVNGPRDLDVGDVVHIAIRLGRLHVDEDRVVNEVAILLDDTGITHVRVGFLE